MSQQEMNIETHSFSSNNQQNEIDHINSHNEISNSDMIGRNS